MKKHKDKYLNFVTVSIIKKLALGRNNIGF